jgi:hypothetical protein
MRDVVGQVIDALKEVPQDSHDYIAASDMYLHSQDGSLNIHKNFDKPHCQCLEFMHVEEELRPKVDRNNNVVSSRTPASLATETGSDTASKAEVP